MYLNETVTYGTETWKFNKNLESNRMSKEMDFFEEIDEMLKIRKKKQKLVLKIRF